MNNGNHSKFATTWLRIVLASPLNVTHYKRTCIISDPIVKSFPYIHVNELSVNITLPSDGTIINVHFGVGRWQQVDKPLVTQVYFASSASAHPDFITCYIRYH